MPPCGYLCISQFIIFNLCLLKFIYVVFLRSWSLIEWNLTRGSEPEFLANKWGTVLIGGYLFFPLIEFLIALS